MNIESKNVVRSRPTRAVFSNVKNERSRRGRSRSASAKRPSNPRPRSRSASRPRTAVVRKMPVARVPPDMRPILSPSTVAAAKAVMGTMYPAKYRNTVGVGENINTPVTAITVTDRYTLTTLADSGAYSQIFRANPSMRYHFEYAVTFSSGLVSSSAYSDSAAYPSLSVNTQEYSVTGMEIRIENNSTSANIQGEWNFYNYPALSIDNRGVGEFFSNPNSSRGFFTDASPSARYVWVRQDSDDDGTIAPTAGWPGTALYCAVVTAAPQQIVIYVTTTWTIIPNAVGRWTMPGTPVNIDESAYRRGMQVFGDMIDENTKLITNPVVADSSHPGIVRRVAEAIASTVGEARLLVNSLMQATALGAAAYSMGSGVATTLFGDPLIDVMACLVSAVPPDIAEVFHNRYLESKCPFPNEVIDALSVLSRYRVHKADKRTPAVIELIPGVERPKVTPTAPVSRR